MQFLLFSFGKTRRNLFLTLAVVKKENEILKRNNSLQKRSIRLQKQDKVERFGGSIRWEALDWLVLVNDNQVRRIVKDYVNYYNKLRPHQGLNRYVPAGYVSQKHGKVRSKPVLSGLHHHYYRAA